MNNKLRVGIVGCGNIFPMHAAPVMDMDGCELVAVCDIKPEVAQQRARECVCAYYTDYREMIEAERLDVVHICTPHYLHAPIAIFAAQHGVHILTEKPMSIRYEDAVEMIETAKACGVTLGVIFQNRYNPGSVLIKNTLESGMLGRIYSAKMSVTWDRSDDYYKKSDWKGTWDKEGGGVIIDQAIHTLDLMRWFIGGEIEYVDASIANRAHSYIEVEDSTEGVIKYQNGIVASFYTVNYYTYDAPVELELHCQKGIAKMVGDKATITFTDGRQMIADRNPEDTFNYGGGKQYWGVSHVKQIANFYQALKNGTQPEISGEEALLTQKIVCAIYDSGKLGKRILF